MIDLRETLWKELVEITSLLNKAGCNYFIVGGVLLGLVREGNIILGDDNIDIGILEKDEELFNNVVIPMMIEDRYKYIDFRENKLIGDKGRVFFFWKRESRHNNNFFFFYKYEDIMWYNVPRYHTPKLPCININVFPAEMFKRLSSIEIKGYKFNVPCYTIEFIELVYGKEWENPIPFREYAGAKLYMDKPCLKNNLLNKLKKKRTWLFT